MPYRTRLGYPSGGGWGEDNGEKIFKNFIKDSKKYVYLQCRPNTTKTTNNLAIKTFHYSRHISCENY